MSWTPIGSPIFGGTGTTSFTVDTDFTEGDIVLGVVYFNYGGLGEPPVTISGGGVLTWTQFGGGGGAAPNSSLPTDDGGIYQFWGVVTTGGPSSIGVDGDGVTAYGLFQEISQSLGALAVSEDTPEDGTNGTADAGNYEPISPTNDGELFVGGMWANAGDVGGASPGFTYVSVGSIQMVYNLDSSGIQSPAWTQAESDIFATFDAFLTTPASGQLQQIMVV